MAKFKISALAPDGDFFTEVYENEFVFGNHSGTKATFIETAGDGDYYTLRGKNFSYDGHTLTHGKITSATFFNAEGVAYATLTGIDVDASKVDKATSLDIGDLLEIALRGKDVVTGSNGDDYLFSGKGADKLSGGAGDDFLYSGGGSDKLKGGSGSDVFVVENTGNSVIMDFDANGGGDQQDYVYFGGGGKTVKDGHNTVYEYENGHTVTLIGVRYSDLTMDDIWKF